MVEYLMSVFNPLFTGKNQWITMFASAFLSATLLPGNSEIIFGTLASQLIMTNQTIFSSHLGLLLFVATLGNGLGSAVTYTMGLLVPKPVDAKNRYARWALEQCNKYGVFALLFSSLPFVGDVLCATAGWLRFNPWLSILFMTLGKLARYLFLLILLYPTLRLAS